MVCPQDRSLIRYGPDYARSAVCNRDAALNRCGSDAAVTWDYPPQNVLITQSISRGGRQPKDWLNAFTSVTLGLAQAVAVERWRAVGLSAMLPTLVLTDGVGAAATPGGIDAPHRHESAVAGQIVSR